MRYFPFFVSVFDTWHVSYSHGVFRPATCHTHRQVATTLDSTALDLRDTGAPCCSTGTLLSPQPTSSVTSNSADSPPTTPFIYTLLFSCLSSYLGMHLPHPTAPTLWGWGTRAKRLRDKRMMPPFEKCLLTFCSVWIPAKGVETVKCPICFSISAPIPIF